MPRRWITTSVLLLTIILITSPDRARSTGLVRSRTPAFTEEADDAMAAGVTFRASVATEGAQTNNVSNYASISVDGRYVAFESRASNLVPGDTNGRTDVFVHDLVTGDTWRVSVASDGTQGNGWSHEPSISANGRYVAFWSYASNLVPDDTGFFYDIFVHDRETGETGRVSVASDSTQGNDSSFRPSISADGRQVAFESLATNLVPSDSNGVDDLFVHDQVTGETVRVSVASDGTQGNGPSWHASISADGRYVAFDSAATNLVPNDTNNWQDVFVHDRLTGVTTRVSVASDGTQGDHGGEEPSISADGRYVAFLSEATNLVPDDTNDEFDVFAHDLATGQTSRVSVSSDGKQGNGASDSPSISPTGRYVAFESLAGNLVAGDTNDELDVFVHDRVSGQTALFSVALGGAAANGPSSRPSISADPSYLAFESEATNLVHADTNGWSDVFVRDREAVIFEMYLQPLFRLYMGQQ